MPGAIATVKGGFWETNGVSSLTQTAGRGSARRRAAQWLDGKGSMAFRAIGSALNGAVAGGAASKTLSRVANSTELGGKRTIETETLISRVTVAGDITIANNDLFNLTSKTTMASPANKDLNPLGVR